MADKTRGQADLAGSKTSSKSADPAPFPLATDSLQDITEIARKLAAYGGGSASLDLAFDLVLHEIVERARTASNATGAAIALIRNGQMVCRATTGENAPDLGVNVEAASGLTGTCLRTGSIRHCRDTESDPSVDAETCRRLGVRSMLLIPLTDANGPFGVLQLFSSSPNAFGGQEMATLLRVADLVAENRSVMLTGTKPVVRSDRIEGRTPVRLKPTKSDHETTANNDVLQSDSSTTKTSELSTVILLFLVIIAAVSLGIVVGWSHGRKAATAPGSSPTSKVVSGERTQGATSHSDQKAASTSIGRVDPSSNTRNEAKAAAAPTGSLIVTENGEVIYRSPEAPAKQFGSKPSGRELIHRVEPDYPPTARAQHIDGTVILDLEIAEDGSIVNVTVVSGNPLLASAAVQAVKQWQYQPDVGGISRIRVTLQFTLPVH